MYPYGYWRGKPINKLQAKLLYSTGFNTVYEYINALRVTPSGWRCGWCGKPNFYYDDLGFFCITPTDNDTRVTCEACYRGPLGEKHIARYGVGER